MFYKCPKCKKIWQYPIEKCPNCFLSLEKIISEEIKIVGVSKVNISTILHPKTNYFVLILEDNKGNRWAEKSFKEYKIGEGFKIEKNKDKSGVAILRVKYDIDSAVEEIIKLVGGVNINSKTRILILPTLISPQHSYLAVNTNPELLDGLIKYLIKIGANPINIKIAAQSFDEIPVEISAQKSQLLDVCVKNKIIPLDISKTSFVKKEKENLIFEISEEVFNSNLIINLPILKLDKKNRIKGSVENTLKFLKKESFFSLKYFHDDFKIIDKLQGILPKYLTIADSINIQKENGSVSFVGLILSSFNSFNLDRVFSEIAMIKDLPDYLKKIEIKNIPIIGRKIEELQYDIEKIGN